ncbi:MAG TPA: TrkA family potassium uptake protein [Polyangiaceae bacterium]|jgi:trk system potassium uptake protein TrkA|nr:MAG: Ktr system potassium uptake protein A [Deltaproteobacteria bacterium ADurb.Bin207]HNS98413.1 TrkA family potassium uptake protein [Polyangiaceae bacterium]HNZ22025.1 TrkA family potassium uptake protein [Polyangiaceae bacterium]HOD22219.1 TrkA family potassium uptake protein [Polyangiaceae bacterium]HOE47333.1 TrkA family potassium uptake protein [Polyangiaceae bacterium]
MKKQALVLGLGPFGMALVRSLTALGVDVLAVDKNPKLTRLAADIAAEAASFDGADEEALARAAPGRRDVCICAIGDESRDSAIMCTALLRQMGARRVIARAADPVLARILKLVGAHEVVNPENAFGERLAVHIAHEGVMGEYPLSAGIIITELLVPEAFVGKTLIELELPRKHGITVVALQRGSDTVPTPDPRSPLRRNDMLVVVSRVGAVSTLLDQLE